MFCKYCATKLGQEISQKCPNCGLVIDVNDGGQSFYEDADLLAWSMTDEEAMASMPKTEVRRIVNQKPPRGGMSAAKGKSKQVNNDTFVNPEKPFVDDGRMSVTKIVIICILAVVVIALLITFVLIKFGGEKTPIYENNNPTSIDNSGESVNEFFTIGALGGEGGDDNQMTEDNPKAQDDVDGNQRIQTVNVVCGDEANNKAKNGRVGKDIVGFFIGDDLYVSINGASMHFNNKFAVRGNKECNITERHIHEYGTPSKYLYINEFGEHVEIREDDIFKSSQKSGVTNWDCLRYDMLFIEVFGCRNVRYEKNGDEIIVSYER